MIRCHFCEAHGRQHGQHPVYRCSTVSAFDFHLAAYTFIVYFQIFKLRAYGWSFAVQGGYVGKCAVVVRTVTLSTGARACVFNKMSLFNVEC